MCSFFLHTICQSMYIDVLVVQVNLVCSSCLAEPFVRPASVSSGILHPPGTGNNAGCLNSSEGSSTTSQPRVRNI